MSLPMLNLTQHQATPDQIAQGLVDLPEAERSVLKNLLDIPKEALEASDNSLQAFLEGRAGMIISQHVLPRIIRQCELLLSSQGGPDDRRHLAALEAVQGALRINVLVEGASILMEVLRPRLRAVGAVPYYALSARVVEEQPQADGSVRKVAIFRHLRFREARS